MTDRKDMFENLEPDQVVAPQEVVYDDAALEAAVKNDLNFYRSPLSVFDLCAKVAALLA